MAAGSARRFFLATWLLAGSLAGAARAGGPQPDKMACIAADTDGQSLRLAGKLLQARKRLAVCAAATCPGIVREDCQERIAELAVAQPTVVFTATNGDGRPLAAVRVLVDGAIAADGLDGHAIPVDPGEHLFVFEAVGRITAQMRLTLREGEKRVRHAVVLRTASGDPVDQVPVPEPLPAADRVVPANLPASATPAAPPVMPSGGSTPVPQAAPFPARQAPAGANSSLRIAAITAGAAGVVGVVVGSVFGLLTYSTWHDAQGGCLSPDHLHQCSPGAVSDEGSASTEGIISTLAFIAGGAGIAAGAWLWFTGPGSSKPASSVRVFPGAGRSGGQLMVRGAF